MLEPSFLKKFHKFEFELDCPVIKLTHQGEESDSYSGPGTIRQGANGELSFKLFCGHESVFGFLSPMVSDLGSGSVIPKSSLYSLKAVDYMGHEWSATDIYPQAYQHKDIPQFITGKLQVICHRNELSLGRFSHRELKLNFFDPLDFPGNQTVLRRESIEEKVLTESWSSDRAEFVADGMNVQLSKENGLSLTISVETDLDCEQLTERICETLRFVFGLRFRLASTVLFTGPENLVRLYACAEKAPHTNPRPPIRFYNPLYSGDVYKLFDTYFTYIKDTKPGYWHPISIPVHGIVEATEASIDALALTLSVGVEGLLAKRVQSANDIILEDNIRHLSEYVRDNQIFELNRERITNAIEALRHPRAIDLLHILAKNNKIYYNHIASWKTLRRRVAHGANTVDWPSQKMYDLVDAVTVLFNCIIFDTIGYEGSFIDYSTRGWQDRVYPADCGMLPLGNAPALEAPASSSGGAESASREDQRAT